MADKPETQIMAEWRAHIPGMYNGAYRKVWDKAMSGKSLRAAITAKCQDCMCWQYAEVKRCTVITCPLYPYRPGVKRPVSSNLARQRATQDAVAK